MVEENDLQIKTLMSNDCILPVILETIHWCYGQSFADVEVAADADIVDAAGVVVAAGRVSYMGILKR